MVLLLRLSGRWLLGGRGLLGCQGMLARHGMLRRQGMLSGRGLLRRQGMLGAQGVLVRQGMLLEWHLWVPRGRAVRLVRIRRLLVRIALRLLVLLLGRWCPERAQVGLLRLHRPGRRVVLGRP
ncbi:MAG: hypothetical protein QOH87_1209 [Trebonia sp.]|nr:hypothetical protein [Trebonia sp.]